MSKLKEMAEILWESGHHKVKLAVVDIDGVLRGKVISLDKFLSVAEGGMGFCNVVFGWDSGDKSYDNVSITGWHTGYPDADAYIDLDTYRRIRWGHVLPFFLADFCHPNGERLAACHSVLLKSVLQEDEDIGYSAMFSLEFVGFIL